MQTWSIKPAIPSKERVELCGLDFIGGYRYFDGVRFFDERLNVERLREALERTVSNYPMLGGTLAVEGGRVFIDFDGPGVTFAVEEVNEPCPLFGPGIPQVNRVNLFLPKPTAPAQPMGQWQSIFGKPLLLLKLTRFNDGRYALGGTTCHMIGDATMTGQWFEDCYRYYSGADTGPQPVFSRDVVTALGDTRAVAPSPKSGLLMGERSFDDIRELFFDARYASVSISPQQFQAIESVVADTGDVTTNDLLHALLMKTFAHVVPESHSDVSVDLVYDIRRIKSFEMPANYCGNTILHRWLPLPRSLVLQTPCTGIAARIRAFGKSDPDSARQDIGFLQREYQSGRVSNAGILSHVQAPLGRGSIIINNMVASPNTKVTFGGMALWTDLAINEPMPIRMAMMYPDLKGGLAIVLVLSQDQIEPFPAAWSRCLEELTSGRLPTRH